MKFRIVPKVFVYGGKARKYYELQSRDWWWPFWSSLQTDDGVEALKDAKQHLEFKPIYL
mgnify:CR=1 FL=1